MRSMSSSSLTPQVSTTQIRQLVTGNARTLLQVTHLSEEENQNILIQRLNKLLLNYRFTASVAQVTEFNNVL